MPLLSPDDHAHLAEHGFLRVPAIVSRERCRAVVDMLFEFLGFEPDQPEDWYRPPLSRGGMIEVYQHQALWDNRQNPDVHRVFAELYGTEALHVSFDRANFNPPVRAEHPEYAHPGMIHWDIDPATAHRAPFRLQGVLYLDDTPAERGGFRCAPGHHTVIERWAATGERVPGAPKPGGRTPADPSEVDIIPVIGGIGDLVVWDSRLLHGNGRNDSDRPRLAQYITMWPASTDPAVVAERVRCWRERTPPNADWALGDPRHWEETHGSTASLTPLGRRLLGADPWPAG